MCTLSLTCIPLPMHCLRSHLMINNKDLLTYLLTYLLISIDLHCFYPVAETGQMTNVMRVFPSVIDGCRRLTGIVIDFCQRNPFLRLTAIIYSVSYSILISTPHS